MSVRAPRGLAGAALLGAAALAGATALLGAGALAAGLPGIAAPAAFAQAELGVHIELTELSPRLVTADGPAMLTVTGRVSNTGDRAIRGLDVRVQRGEPAGSEDDLRAALTGGATADTARPRFVDLPDALNPGGSAPFRVDVPLRGGTELDSLQIGRPGVYPLLVNLNGRPDFGGRARLAAVRLLLPVLGLPATTTAPAARPSPAAETPVTVLWPLVDVPHRLPTADDAQVILRDDSLAVSLAPGGRLYGLLQAALLWAPAGSPLGSALCAAVDPDLVDTVRLMAGADYQLADGAPGAGRQAAADWLRGLRELAAGHCVLALPMADADLVALSRAGLTDLQGRARTDGAEILREVLGVEPVSELAWPAGELLDERTLTDLASLGATAVLLRRDGLSDPARYAGQAAVGLATGVPATASQRGVLVDDLVGDALAGASAPAPDRAQATGQPPPPDGPLAAQDGLATLVYRATSDAAGATGASDATGATGAAGPAREPAGVLLAPPRRWAAGATENVELLRTAVQLIAGGWARPRGIAELTGGAAPALTGTLDYPARASTGELATSVTASIAGIRDQLRDLEAATKRDPRVGYDPARLFNPMRATLLRAASGAWRGHADTGRYFVQRADATLRTLRESVKIVPPGGPYLLAASNSPLLLNLDNPLPVQIDVRITLSAVAGLRTAPVDVITLPAGSRRQVRVPAEVIRAGHFSVEAQLSTPGGTRLGPRGAASRIQLRSTAYGTVTLALTGTAAVALVLLAALRITRRVRAARQAEAAAATEPPAAEVGEQS